MKGLKRFFKGMMGYLTNEKGYTLSEMTAVIAVTATLTALAIPVVADKVQEGRLARAAMDVNGLNQALASFQSSLAYWPGDPANPNAGGLTAAIKFLFVGTEGITPPAGATGWEAGENIADHVVTNKVGGTGAAIYTECTEDIRLNCWSGPYIGGQQEDPWGHKYLVNIQGFYDKDPAAGFGWIISAGPDGVINTPVTDAELDGDDIGIMAK